MSRHYTVEEATGHLQIVKPILRDAIRLKQQQQRLVDELESAPVTDDDADAAFQREIQRVRDQIRERIDFIHALGVQVKDLDHGLIDFPHMRDGEEVLLCWRLGEDRIGFWHTYEDGFAGRKPI